MNNVIEFSAPHSEHPLQEAIDKAVKNGRKANFNLATGLCLIVRGKGKADFIYRVQQDRQRKQIKLGTYNKKATNEDFKNGIFNLAKVLDIADDFRAKIAKGRSPTLDLHAIKNTLYSTVDSLFLELLEMTKLRVKSTVAMERNYWKEISPKIGSANINKITSDDIQCIINCVLSSKRKTVAHKCLYLSKSLFNYAESKNICLNVTRNMTVREHAGGEIDIKGIALEEHDLETNFRLMQDHESTFHPRHYYAVILLSALGIRKAELITAKWQHLDLKAGLLHIDRERVKTKTAIAVPVSAHLQPIISKLWRLADGSEYLFPAFVKSTNGHMCVNTLNTALKRLYREVRAKENSSHVMHHTVHDLRRTFRTLLRSMKVENDVAELCINHRSGKDAGLSRDDRYNRYVKLKERREAHDKVAKKVMELTTSSTKPVLSIAA